MRGLDLTILSTFIVIFCAVIVLIVFEFSQIMQTKNQVMAKNSRNELQKARESNNNKERTMSEYFVISGDSLSSISMKFFGSGVEWDVIAEANNIDSADEIQSGKRLLIPFKSSKGYYQMGTASWYGRFFHGKETASGKSFDMYDYTAAHRTLPLGSKVRVVNLQNGKDIIVNINDRGPYIKNRIIDLSYSAAKSLGIIDRGIQDVKIEVLSIPSV